jgi:hypothetical protein
MPSVRLTRSAAANIATDDTHSKAVRGNSKANKTGKAKAVPVKGRKPTKASEKASEKAEKLTTEKLPKGKLATDKLTKGKLTAEKVLPKKELSEKELTKLHEKLDEEDYKPDETEGPVVVKPRTQPQRAAKAVTNEKLKELAKEDVKEAEKPESVSAIASKESTEKKSKCRNAWVSITSVFTCCFCKNKKA